MQPYTLDLIRNKVSTLSSPLRLRVTSGSMSPFISVGDWILVEAADSSEISPGDVVVYESCHRFTCHRVVKKDAAQLVTKGDASLSPDPLWEPSLLLGRVVGVSKGRVYVSMRARGWRIANRVLALSSTFQYNVWNACSLVKRQVLGSKRTGLSSLLVYVLRLPTRLALGVFLAGG